MNKDFLAFYDKIPELLESFVTIQKTMGTARQAIGEITKTLQKEGNFYYAAVRILKGQSLVLDSVLGKNQEDVEYALAYGPLAIPINKTKNEYVANVMGGKLQIYSGEQKNAPFSNSTPFPFLVSWISLPIQKARRVIGVIELGSEEFIFPPRYKYDAKIFSAFKLQLEFLLSKINQIADSKP
jgi:hypothetical protein